MFRKRIGHAPQAVFIVVLARIPELIDLARAEIYAYTVESGLGDLAEVLIRRRFGSVGNTLLHSPKRLKNFEFLHCQWPGKVILTGSE